MGFVKIDNVCVDMCEGINCGIAGNCLNGNCTCQTGYENIGNFCRDMCEGINCGKGGECFSGICSDMIAACDGNPCHNGGTCRTTSQADSQLGLIAHF